MTEAVIVSTARTPIGRAAKGSLVDARPDDLAAFAVNAALEQVPELPREEIVDVMIGCGFPQERQGMNLGRRVALLAGLPETVPGTTVNRFCASSLQTIRMAFHAIKAGEGEAFVAGGVESTSQVSGYPKSDEELHPALFGDDAPIVSYGLSQRADFRASNYRTEFGGTSFQLDARSRSYLVRLPLIGRFNVANALAALAAANSLGVNLRDAVLSLSKAPQVPGRLEAVPAKRQFQTFVDYAHTPDALFNVLKTLRELAPRKLIVVFGAGGDRDQQKRPLMGRVADQNADHSIITSDNPRKEDPLAIIEQIKKGFRGSSYEAVPDRTEAIARAIALAQPRDIVLIAGKGHEAYQEFADHTVPFDDVQIARRALENRPLEF